MARMGFMTGVALRRDTTGARAWCRCTGPAHEGKHRGEPHYSPPVSYGTRMHDIRRVFPEANKKRRTRKYYKTLVEVTQRPICSCFVFVQTSGHQGTSWVDPRVTSAALGGLHDWRSICLVEIECTTFHCAVPGSPKADTRCCGRNTN